MSAEKRTLRQKLNEEKILFLQKSDNFQADLSDLRKKYIIPLSNDNNESDEEKHKFDDIIDVDGNKILFKVVNNNYSEKLKPADDLIYFSFGDNEEYGNAESSFVNDLDVAKQKQFKVDIKNILIKYDLPAHFYNWVQYYLLYINVPPWELLYNDELIFDVSDDNNEALRIGFTTEEKLQLKNDYRRISGIKKGRVPEKIKENYDLFCGMLGNSKNMKRRSRTQDTALQTLELLNKEISFTKNSGDSERTIEKRKYADIVGEVYGTDLMEKEKQQLQNLRKIVERHRKRNKLKPIKKPKK